MYKLLIADDEPKIRRGLSKLKWDTIDVEVVDEASDGIEAFEKALRHKPDIMLVDINMPFLNGLELIKKLKSHDFEGIIIIVSGFDEFKYAREALKQNVFDYILKPVNRTELFNTVKNGIEHLTKANEETEFVKWATSKVVSDQDIMIKNFFKHWIAGGLNDYEVNQNLQVFNINMSEFDHLLLIQTLPIHVGEQELLDDELFEFSILNVTEETLQKLQTKLCVRTEKSVYLAFYSKATPIQRLEIVNEITYNVNKYLKLQVNILDVDLDNNISMFTTNYMRHLEALKQSNKLSPLVMLAKNFIESHYNSYDLSIDDVAKYTRVSSSHLSKSIRKELGYSYTDLLTKVRIEKAIRLMEDPILRMYEIAEKVGYSTQHYFSTTFKKEMGMSPANYRKDKYKYD